MQQREPGPVGVPPEMDKRVFSVTGAARHRVVCSQFQRQSTADTLAGDPKRSPSTEWHGADSQQDTQNTPIPSRAWEWLATLSWDAVMDYPSLMVPHRAQALFAACVMIGLRHIVSHTDSDLGWRLVFLIPDLLLRPLPRGQKGVQRVIMDRCKEFILGGWEGLIYSVISPRAETSREYDGR